VTRVLLTGATGFVGRHVLQTLVRHGYDVQVAGRHRPDAPAGFIETDLLDAGARRAAVECANASHLLHLAWIADPGIYWRSPLNLDWAAASLDLVKHFHERGGVRAVIAGSCAEYQWGTARFQENVTSCRPATLYGSAKDATRRLVMAYAREAGLSAAWGRLFFLYGPGEKPGRLISDAIAALRDDRDLPTSQGFQRRDFLHVADVAGALVALLGRKVDGPVNIGSGEATAVRSILEALADRLGHRERLLYGGRPLGPGDPPVIEADPTRLFSEVGFRPRFNLASGLDDTISASHA
jgi:nucleoside-diphosphate-sugar epimerase